MYIFEFYLFFKWFGSNSTQSQELFGYKRYNPNSKCWTLVVKHTAFVIQTPNVELSSCNLTFVLDQRSTSDFNTANLNVWREFTPEMTKPVFLAFFFSTGTITFETVTEKALKRIDRVRKTNQTSNRINIYLKELKINNTCYPIKL